MWSGGEKEQMVQKKRKAREVDPQPEKNKKTRREAGPLKKSPASPKDKSAVAAKKKRRPAADSENIAETKRPKRKKSPEREISSRQKPKRQEQPKKKPVRKKPEQSGKTTDEEWAKIPAKKPRQVKEKPKPQKKTREAEKRKRKAPAKPKDAQPKKLKAKEAAVPVAKRPAPSRKRPASRKTRRSHEEIMEEEQQKEFRLQVILTGLVIVLGAVILFGIILFSLSVGKGYVNGNSMSPTLENKDKVVFLRYEQVDAFDIVAFRPPNHPDEQYVKRVIGMPGDKVSYEDGVMIVNKHKIKEKYIVYGNSDDDGDFVLQDIIEKTEGLEGSLRKITKIPDDMYLVLGDNRDNSEDSRTFGLITKDDIIGVVRFRYSPLDSIGVIH